MSVHNRQIVQKISNGLKSRYPLIYILGWEEERIERLLGAVAQTYFGEGNKLRVWSTTSGFEDDTAEPVTDPVDALVRISDSERPAMYLMKDLPAWFDDKPALIRAARDLYYKLRNKRIFVFWSYPSLQLPDVLKKEVYLVEMDLPTEDEIFDHLIATRANTEVNKDQLYRFAGAMKGLSMNEVMHLQSRIFHGGRVEPAAAMSEIHSEKAAILRKESCLQFYPPQGSIDSIGGLDNLKEWVAKRKDLFTEKAYRSGIPLPSGILMMGVSGCGKSMAAKVIAGVWDLPLVRLDMSLVLSGSFGMPEYAFEHATKMAEEVSPIVLWVDEIENSFGYDDLGGDKGGGNVNIFSSFLTWLQEKSPKVFVAATANRIQLLPAELMRKGRFDQLFFLDLPNKQERMDIFRIHIRNNGGNIDGFNLAYLAAATKEWSGAEIEQVIKSARINAYQEDPRLHRE